MGIFSLNYFNVLINVLCHTKYVNTLPPLQYSTYICRFKFLHTSKVKEAHTVAMSIDVKNNKGLLTLGVGVIISLNWSCGSLCTWGFRVFSVRWWQYNRVLAALSYLMSRTLTAPSHTRSPSDDQW